MAEVGAGRHRRGDRRHPRRRGVCSLQHAGHVSRPGRGRPGARSRSTGTRGERHDQTHVPPPGPPSRHAPSRDAGHGLVGIWPRHGRADRLSERQARMRGPRSTGCCARAGCSTRRPAPCARSRLAAYWPDCIKTLGERFSYASPWHYQNVDICRPFDLPAPCGDGNCVSAQIERQRPHPRRHAACRPASG